MTFTPIETQEQLDKVIGERINFAKEKAKAELEEKYKGYVSPDDYTKKIEEINAQITSSNTSLEEANKKLEDASKENAELKGKLGVYEANSVKTRIALEEGLPYEMALKLEGADEDQMREDARKMAKYFSTSTQVPPLREPQAPSVDGVTAAFLKNNPNIKI